MCSIFRHLWIIEKEYQSSVLCTFLSFVSGLAESQHGIANAGLNQASDAIIQSKTHAPCPTNYERPIDMKKHLAAAAAFSLVLSCSAVSAADSFFGAIKEAGRSIGHATRDITREIGHTTRDTTKEIGHAFRDGTSGKKDADKKGADKKDDAKQSEK